MKFLLIFAFVVVFIEISSSLSINIECDMLSKRYKTTGDVHTCDLSQINLNVVNKNDEIANCTAFNQRNWSCVPVYAFYAHRKGLAYIPKSLSTFLPQLVAISIVECGLKEIHRFDLKNFTKLRELHLHSNEIEFLEENLFRFNPDMQVGKFKHIF